MTNIQEIKNDQKSILVGFDACPFCTGARKYLDNRQIDYEYIKRGVQPALEDEIKKTYNHHTYPMIFMKGVWLGGFDSLKEYLQ